MKPGQIMITLNDDEFERTKAKLIELAEIAEEINKTLDAHWFTRLVMKIIRWTS